MGPVETRSRRLLLKRLAALGSLGTAIAFRSAVSHAADAPLISVDDPAATAVKYVEDAANAREAAPGSTCANCALYQGKNDSKIGPCQIFPGKTVVAAGWCKSWAPQM